MRLFLTIALSLFAMPALAAVAWTEASENGRIVTRWTRGADLNEVHAATRAVSGPNYRVIEICRQVGYFAFVGSDIEPQRGVSCGYETKEAALHMARLNCENEGGRCDVERVGYDDGAALLGDDNKAPRLPADLPGSSASAGDIRAPTGPLALQ